MFNSKKYFNKRTLFSQTMRDHFGMFDDVFMKCLHLMAYISNNSDAVTFIKSLLAHYYLRYSD